MKKVGIICGGFKPFTSGHYSLLLAALSECDLVQVAYGMSGRKKAGTVYDAIGAADIFKIVKSAAERAFGDRLRIVPYVGSPATGAFEMIESFVPGDERVTVYSDPDDIRKFTVYIGTPKEKLYFGNMIADGRLSFRGLSCEDALRVNCMRERPKFTDYPERASSVRASQLREMIVRNDDAEAIRFLPDFLTEEEAVSVIKIARTSNE